MKKLLTIITVLNNLFVIQTGATFTGFSNPVSKWNLFIFFIFTNENNSN